VCKGEELQPPVSKLNTATTRGAGTSVATAEFSPTGVTALGGSGYSRDTQTELFLLGVANFVGEDEFHESAVTRDERFATLIREVGLLDPDWISRYLPWLRDRMNMRTAPVVGAAEFVRARQEAGIHDDSHRLGLRGVARRTVDSVLQRPDEPGEILAYWLERYGKRMPFPLKKGVADAVTRLYTGKAVLAYDSDARALRFGDVIELTHPKASAGWKSDVLHYALDRRHKRSDPHVGDVRTLRARAELMAVPLDQRRAVILADGAADVLTGAAMTWKALAGWLQGPMDAAAWSAILPSMGYMSRLRNLRNFDQQGLPDELAEQVAAMLCDPQEVARSRQFPLRYVSAYRHIVSDRWAWALEKALDLSLDSIPQLDGRTLILIDTSHSMHSPLSKRSTLMRWDAAVTFGLAVARRCEAAEVVSFSSGWPPIRQFPLVAGESLLRSIRRWEHDGYFLDRGTDTVRALRTTYQQHDRVLIVTDEQAQHDHQLVTHAIPSQVPLYTWNLGGYRYGHSPAGRSNRYVLGGLSDAAFQVVPILERGKHAAWPF
jgi:hypothetical protein